VEVEDEVKLAHTLEELVKELDEEVDRLEIKELVVVDINAEGKVQRSITSVDKLVVAEFNDVGEFAIAIDDGLVNLALQQEEKVNEKST
jgi:hypothetical protein